MVDMSRTMTFAEAQEYVNGDAADVWQAVATGELIAERDSDDEPWSFRA